MIQAGDWITEIMAYDRKSFKNKLLGILSGAIVHFYMVKLAELNRQKKWVQHWATEVDRLINMDFVVIVLSEIKGKWDKTKAVEETFTDLRAADKRYRGAAARYVSKVFKLKRINQQLAAGVEDEFYMMVREALESALA